MTKRIAPDTPAVYTPNPLHMGAFRDCPNEIIAQIIARAFSSGDLFTAVKHVSLVCKAFQWISNQRFTFDSYLDHELKGKATFIFESFVVYRRLFERKYQGVLASPQIFTRYPQFTHLDISDPRLGDQELAALIDGALAAGCQLQSLKLNNCMIKTLDLSRLKSLKELHLSGCVHLEGALDFTGLDQLQSLTLNNCGLLSGFIYLDKLKKLKKLEVKECLHLQGPLPLKDLSQLKILKWDRNFAALCAAGSLDLKGLTQLEILDLSNCLGMTEVLGLNELKLLKVFRMNGSNRPLEQLDLDGLDQLEHLDLNESTQLAALFRLNTLHRLKTLELTRCTRLPNELDLDGLDRLEYLVLTDCTQLTELRNLKKLQCLKEIDARGCERLAIDRSELSSAVLIWVDESSSDED